MALGELVVKLSADVAQFQSDMGKAAHIANQQSLAIQKSIGQIKTIFKTVFAGVRIEGFRQFVSNTIDAADKLNDLQKRTGATGQELITLQGAAMLLERSSVGTKLSLFEGWRGRTFALAVVTLPVFALFPPVFILRVMLPFFETIKALP